MRSDGDRALQQFIVEPEDRTDKDAIWDDQLVGPKPIRKPTRAEKLSIILVGVTAIGFIVLLAVTIIVAIYISRQ